MKKQQQAEQQFAQLKAHYDAGLAAIEQMMRILEGLPDRFEVCYEASCGYGHYHDLLRPVAARVLVAHPGQLRLIFRSKNKNDRNDAFPISSLTDRTFPTWSSKVSRFCLPSP